MLAITSSNAVLVVIVYVAYRVLWNWYTSYRFARFASQNDCAEVHYHKYPFPWSLLDPVLGIQNSARVLKAGGDLLDDVLLPDFAFHNTWKRTDVDYTTRISTIEPANLQAILATQFEDFGVGKLRYKQFSPMLSKSIFTTDGSFWQHSRAVLRPQFNRDNINDLEMTELASQALIDAIGPVDTRNWTEDTELQPLLYSFTIDTATEFLFGQSLGSQTVATLKRRRAQQGLPPSDDAISAAADQASSEQFLSDLALVSSTAVGRISLQGLYFLADGLAFRRAIANMKRFASNFVDRAISSPSSPSKPSPSPSPSSQRGKPNFIASLAPHVRDRDELRNQALAILFAGRDTTASLIGWCLTRLALHPDVCARLRSAVLRDFGTGRTDGGGGDEDEVGVSEVNFASLKACRPLQHFLNEVLRLHPPVPVNNRIAAKDTTLPVGGGPDQKGKVAVRKGQAVSFSVYALHRRRDLWGEDALEFKPERWQKKVAAWHYLPFHGGPRICLGQQYALTESGFLLVRLLQKFDAIEPVDRDEMSRLRTGLGLATRPLEGVRIRLHQAS